MIAALFSDSSSQNSNVDDSVHAFFFANFSAEVQRKLRTSKRGQCNGTHCHDLKVRALDASVSLAFVSRRQCAFCRSLVLFGRCRVSFFWLWRLYRHLLRPKVPRVENHFWPLWLYFALFTTKSARDFWPLLSHLHPVVSVCQSLALLGKSFKTFDLQNFWSSKLLP